MKVTFIMPSVGRKKDSKKYIRTWMMEPLGIAVLASLTPAHIEREFFDDRLEEIDFDTKTDLVAMSVETYCARRAYEIAYRFKQRGIKVIMGGFHPTLYSQEVIKYADAAFIGQAEELWPTVLQDLEKGELKSIYRGVDRPNIKGIFPDRSIFKDKKYLSISLVETGRGCTHHCEFCTIHPFYRQCYQARPIEDVIKDIKASKQKRIFFVDDNIISDFNNAKKLFRALIPLKIQWFSQATINIAKDQELLDLMKQSGCMGVLIGFESLNNETLRLMNKEFNSDLDRDEAIETIHAHGLKIYATFVFGNDNDSIEVFEQTYQFAKKHKFYITAYNHIVPFPGSELYDRLKSEKRLFDEKYWLNHSYTFGQIAYRPQNFDADQLTELCYQNRKRIYSARNLIARFFLKRNFSNLSTPIILIVSSLLARKDVNKRQGLPMGMGWKIE